MPPRKRSRASKTKAYDVVRGLKNRARELDFPGRLNQRATKKFEARLREFVEASESNLRSGLRYDPIPGSTVDNAVTGMETFRIIATRRFSMRTSIDRLYSNIVKRVKAAADLKPADVLYIWISNQGRSVSLKPTKVRDMKDKALAELVAAVVQSNELFDITTARIHVRYIRSPQGAGYIARALPLKVFIKSKRCIIQVEGGKVSCFWQALAIGCAQYSTDMDALRALRVRKGAFQQRREVAGARLWFRCFDGRGRVTDPVSTGEFPEIEKCMEASFYVIELPSLRFIYESNRNDARKIFFTHYAGDGGGHYDAVDVKRVGALWSKCKFCMRCLKAHKAVLHRCRERCPACRDDECAGVGSLRSTFQYTCSMCNMNFFDHVCYTKHLDVVCKMERKCRDCGLIYNVESERHHCDTRKCCYCGGTHLRDTEHECYHRPLTVKGLRKPTKKYIFYDFECFLEKGHHIPAMIIAMYLESDDVFCFNNLEEFGDWLFSMNHKGFTCIAHNGAKYDIHFVKQLMLTRRLKTKDIVKGRCILYSEELSLGIRFVDSFRFIPIGLRRFAKTFGIQDVEKGYFPYRFFTENTRAYSGVLPELEWFDFHLLKKKEREEALIWYERNKMKPCNLYQMCRSYCIDDVMLLKEGCKIFRELFMGISEGLVDPFQYITIASVCMTLYKLKFLPDRMIAWLPHDQIEKESQMKYLWLQHKTLTEGCDIKWMDISKELQCDGFTLEPERVCYLYGDCVSTGCNICFERHSINIITGRRMFEHSFEYGQRISVLRERGWRVIKVKGCEWKKELSALGHLYKEMLVELIKEKGKYSCIMRDGFFGGRTEVFKLYYKCAPGERIRYRDYTSLYPSIQFGQQNGVTPETYGVMFEETPYPVGIPTRLTESFGDVSMYFGFVSCRVKPPKDLYLPLLPRRSGGKLIFDLKECDGTWTTIELNKAVQLGYEICQIYEVLHFPERSNDLFKGYVKMAMKLKQEAAGWDRLAQGDASDMTDEEKEMLIDEYSMVQGIELDASRISNYNAGLYFTAKLCANSLWGKFAQSSEHYNTVEVFNDADFVKYIFSDKYDVRDVFFHDDMARTIVFRDVESYRFEPRICNIPVAAFTTAYARLRLYAAMEAVGENVLYCDTDSVIYVEREGEKSELVVGNCLGDLTDELEEDDFIVEFVATGPKSYAYRTWQGKTECKVKGFTLNHESSEVLNLESLKGLVFGEEDDSLVTRPLLFDINEKHEIVTRDWGEDGGKKFKLTFDKRQVIEAEEDCIDTLPFYYENY